MLTTQSRKASVMKLGKLSTNTCLPWLMHGADKGLFYYGDWIKEPGVAIVSCNDGLRPVIMKLETTDEDAKIEYTPVER